MRSSAREMPEQVEEGLVRGKTNRGTLQGLEYRAPALVSGKTGRVIGLSQEMASAIARVWRDVLIVMVLAAGAGFASFQGAKCIDPVVLYVNEDAMDVWFGSDVPRVFSSMTALDGNHSRAKVHPLFSLVAYPPVKALRILGVETIVAVRIVLAAVASLWIIAMFILLRLVGCRRLDATLFTMLAATSASAVFWFVVPETYPFGSLTILLGLVTVSLAQHRKLPEVWYIIVSALTLSVTVTNWMVGIFATFATFRWRRALQITVNAFCLVVLLWGVQKFIFPSAQFFIGDREEINWIRPPEFAGSLRVVTTFVFHTMVMPAIEWFDHTDWPGIRNQHSLPGSGSLWGAIAVGLWIPLLALGLWGLFSAGRHGRLRVVLGLTLIGQLLLHLIYGAGETFIYALHFGPLLVVLTALSVLTPARKLGLTLAALLVLCAGVNNVLQLNKAVKIVEYHMMLPRQAAKSALIKRPHDTIPGRARDAGIYADLSGNMFLE